MRLFDDAEQVVTPWRALARGPLPETDARTGKAFGITFALEGLSIGIGNGALAALEQPDHIASWAALCVGLHFFPLSVVLKQRLDHLLGALIVAAAVGMTLTLPGDVRPVWIAVTTSGLLMVAGWGRVLKARQMGPRASND